MILATHKRVVENSLRVVQRFVAKKTAEEMRKYAL